jgi:two-component system response regulator YesN
MKLRRIFLQFFATYLLLIVIPLIAGLVMNSSLVSEYENKVEETQLSLLNQTIAYVDGLLEDIQWQSFQISGSTSLLRFINSPPGDAGPTGESATLQREILNQLHDSQLYGSSNDSAFYIIFRDRDTIFTPYTIYHREDFSDGKTFLSIEGTSNAAWHRMLFSRYHHGTVLPVRRVTIEDFKNKLMIPYIQSIPLSFSGNAGDIEAVLVYFIGADDVTAILGGQNYPPGGYGYIADAGGAILIGYSEGDRPVTAYEIPEGQDQGMFRGTARDEIVIFSRSRRHGWTYVSVLPRSWVFRRVRTLQVISALVLTLGLIIAVALASAIAYRRSTAVSEIFTGLSDALDDGASLTPDYRHLNLGVKRLIESNSSLSREVKKQREFVFSNFINRLLNGYYGDPETLKEFENYLGIGNDATRFCVVSSSFLEAGRLQSLKVIEELNQVKVVIRSMAADSLKDALWSYEPSDDRLVLIIRMTEENEKQQMAVLLNVLSDMQSFARTHMPPGLAAGIGSAVSGLARVQASYLEAREAESFFRRSADRQIRSGIWAVAFKDIEKDLENYYYPLELEAQLMNAVRAADEHGVADILDRLEEENFVQRRVSAESLRFFLLEMKSTVAKLVSALRLDPRDFDLAEGASPRESYGEIRRRLEELRSHTGSRKKSHNSELLRRILSYLQGEYADCNISLTSVAGRFSISESYLSFFVKEQTGENFSHHLERIRVDAARDLLESGDEPIHRIASRVGYASDKTFRRVFRRVTGFSPTEYRDQTRR